MNSEISDSGWAAARQFKVRQRQSFGCFSHLTLLTHLTQLTVRLQLLAPSARRLALSFTRNLILRPRLRVQQPGKIIAGEFVIGVNPQRGSEMGFGLLEIPLS